MGSTNAVGISRYRATAEQANARPIASAHSILEIVNHVAAWLEIVRQRVAGTAPLDITTEMDWPPVGGGGDAEWPTARQRLDRAGANLRATVAALDDESLEKDLPGIDDTWSAYVSLHGVVQHVLYHAGQIALLKKGVLPS